MTKIDGGIKMLEHGRIDVLVDYESDLKLNSDRNMDFDKRYSIKRIKPGKKLFLAFSNTPQSKRFIKIYDERIPELLETGEIERIYKKWGQNMSKFLVK